MALGISGSNGGITANQEKVFPDHLRMGLTTHGRTSSIEVSYFVNNVCNLKCKHCYVGYQQSLNALSTDEWRTTFDELISLGALTFGNVGKEPTLNWSKSRELLCYLSEKRRVVPEIRFGFVTNGILLDQDKIQDLDRIRPNYIDISLDGAREDNDQIRGSGTYERVIRNLKIMSRYPAIEKVFISFTANRFNLSSFCQLVAELYDIGVRNFLVSPYVTLQASDELFLSNELAVRWAQDLVAGRVIDFPKYQRLNVYFKNDYTTTRSLMSELLARKIIDLDNLFIDDYGVIFSKYCYDSSHLYFNYLPWDNSYAKAVRISHDGYVSNCLDMFFADYPERAIGNVRKRPISEILKCGRRLSTPTSVQKPVHAV